MHKSKLESLQNIKKPRARDINIKLVVVIFLFIFAVVLDRIFKPIFATNKYTCAGCWVWGGEKAYTQEESPKKKALDQYYATQYRYMPAEINWAITNAPSVKFQPLVSSRSGIIVNPQAGIAYVDLDSRTQRPIASLTKIMTFVVALEHGRMDKKIVISQKAATIGENAMGVYAGEVYTLEELLYGLVLHSGNDAAYAIAEGVAGDVDTFVFWMDVKARELGLTDTEFFDPSGLDDRTYSTAFDMAKLTRYALKFPEFKEVVKTTDKELPETLGHRALSLWNQTNLLRTYPGAAGVKTGYTEEAGMCLITYAVNEGKELIGVVLNSLDRRGEMIMLLDFSFDELGIVMDHGLLD